MAHLVTNHNGFSIIEVMVVVTIIGLLAVISVPNYQEFKRNSHRQAATAHLASYHRSAKIMIGEFGYNPGNFVAIGFEPEGDYYYRIIAADNTEDPPAYYPNEDNCVSTHSTSSTCQQISPHLWQELLNNAEYKSKTAEVKGKRFKVYAVSDKADDYLCTDQTEVYIGDCP